MSLNNVFICLQFIIFSIFDNVIGAEFDYFKRELSLTKPYQGSGMTIPNWEFYGSTMVTGAFIRLTPDQQSKTGGLYNKNPFNLRNWEIQMHFKVSGKQKDLFGDGMAFWYIKDDFEAGSVFGNKDRFTGLGVFFDTYANQNGVHGHGHPYISAMINNGTVHYDHDRDGTHTEIAGCESKFRGIDTDTFVTIRYENDVLSLSTDLDSDGVWEKCFSVDGIILPIGYRIGVSAATGELSDNHDIISIKTFELSTPYDVNEDRSNIQPSAKHFAAPRERIEDKPPSMSNLKFFLIIVGAIIGVILLIAAAILVFQRQQEISRKRFY